MQNWIKFRKLMYEPVFNYLKYMSYRNLNSKINEIFAENIFKCKNITFEILQMCKMSFEHTWD